MALREEWEHTRGATTSFRAVTLNDDGSLLIEGQDLGALPEQLFGSREYEFERTVDATGVRRLRQVLGIAPDEPLLPALRARFATTHELERAIEDAGIDSRFWCRSGD